MFPARPFFPFGFKASARQSILHVCVVRSRENSATMLLQKSFHNAMRQMMPPMISRDSNISQFQGLRRKLDAALFRYVGGVLAPFALDRSDADDLFVLPDDCQRGRTR